MILVEKNNSNEIAFTAVDQKVYDTGIYKLKFKSSVTKQEKYVIPDVVADNARYILLEFIESATGNPNNGYITLRGGFYPNGEYTYELWEVNASLEELALIEKGEMKLTGENIDPEIQYFFYQGNNENTSAYVYVTPASPAPEFEFWNTNENQWQLEDEEWQNA